MPFFPLVVRVILIGWGVGVGAVLAHEAGHAIAACILGVGFREIAVFRLRLVLDGNGPLVSLADPNRRSFGHVSLAPRRARGLRWRLALIHAAGPAAEIALYVGILWAATASGLPWPFAAFFVLPGLLRYIPRVFSQGLAAFGSDGLAMRICLDGGPVARRTLAAVLLNTQIRDGVRPRDWDAGEIALLAGMPDGPASGPWGSLWGYYHFLDRGDLATAGQWLDRLVTAASRQPAGRYDSLLEGAYFTAHARGDAQEARRLFETALDADPRRAALNAATSWDGFSPRLRAELAVLVAERRSDEASRLADAAVAHARTLPLPTKQARTSFHTEMEWIREVLRPLAAAAATPWPVVEPEDAAVGGA